MSEEWAGGRAEVVFQWASKEDNLQAAKIIERGIDMILEGLTIAGITDADCSATLNAGSWANE